MLSWIEIDGVALRHNYRIFCDLAGRERVAPVLKSNAYGHGLPEVYQALAPENPAWLCTNYVQEASQLRALGFKGRLLVVGPAVARELADAARLEAELVVGNAEVLHAWLAAAQPGRIHIKIDTGMSRQGFLPKDVAAVAELVRHRGSLVAGVCTHFANVEDVTDHSYATLQLERFGNALAAFRAVGLTPMAHAASSASALIMDDSRFDLERVGVSLYGVWPSALTRVSFLQLSKHMIELRPALSWRAEVTSLKAVEAGQFIGYGCTYRAVRDMRIAVLPVGYYEGYPRLASDSAAYVLIRGERCPLVGRLCMNMMMVDTTHLAAVAVGDTATLIGTDRTGGKAETLTAAEVATWSRTIHYEILARLHPDVPRRLNAASGQE